MEVLAYKEFIDTIYFPFIFTEMKESIDKAVAAAFPDDKPLAIRCRNEAFSLCRDICSELYREIPTEELQKAYEARSRR